MLLSELTNTFFPFCSLAISLFLYFLFFSKKHVENLETKMYSYLVVCSLFESFLYFFICFTGDFFFNSSTLFFYKILNKILVVIYIVWMTLFYFYTLIIVSNVGIKAKERIKKCFIIFDIIVILLVLISPIDLVLNISDKTSNAYGMAINILYFTCSVYLFLIVLSLIWSLKRFKDISVRKKFFPMIMLSLLFLISLIIRAFDPYFNITSNIFSFVLLIMYHTIENPDVKMLNELELAKKNAERANDAKTEFLSSMSHEIRTPLNAIVGFSNAILEDKTLEEAKEEAKDIIMASNNLLEIVNGILDISKIEAGKMEIVNVDYKLIPMCNDIVKLSRPRIGEKPIELKCKFSSDIPAILHGDQGKIKEIITNILTNAIKYTERGLITFEVSCINYKNTTRLMISIEDTGRGIKPDKIDKLFTKFNRLEEDRNTTLEGTGLGLAITKSLVDMMNGKIIVQSKYGSGSKFTVYLSQKIVSMNDNAVEDDVKEVELVDYSSKKVLVVDDNNLNIKVAVRLLRNFKIVPDTCVSGIECLEKVKENKYDLILLDDMMPKFSGVDTFHKLKENEDFETPVVILTANAITGMKEKYMKEGLDDYLAKPIDKLELIRVLDKFLNKK